MVADNMIYQYHFLFLCFPHILAELENAVHKLEEENVNLKFLFGEYQQQIAQLETESSKKSDRILQLQEKNLRAVVTTPGKPVSIVSNFFFNYT